MCQLEPPSQPSPATYLACFTFSIPNPRKLQNMFITARQLLQYDKDDGTDITLVCQGRRKAAHAAVLMARSPFLKAMVQRWTNQKREIVLDGCDPEVLSVVVGYMYGKDLPELADCLCKVLEVSERFLMADLKAEVEKMLGISSPESAQSQTADEEHEKWRRTCNQTNGFSLSTVHPTSSIFTRRIDFHHTFSFSTTGYLCPLKYAGRLIIIMLSLCLTTL